MTCRPSSRFSAIESNARSTRRAGFTLFELILAIALSAALLALIGMAINLYLKRVDMSRTRVEEAQLARSILSKIADDLRATAIYQPQDVSSVAQLMASSESFDVDSIDEERDESSGGGPGSTSAPGGSGGLSAVGTSGGVGGAGSTGTSTGNSTTPDAGAADSEMPLGVSGSLGELNIDAARLPRGDELFGTMTGYTNAPMAAQDGNPMASTGSSWGSMPSPSDLKTIRYFIREGDRSDGSGLAATSLAPEMQIYAGGLVRQEIPRAARLFAEQTADSAVLDSGQRLIAPEVVQIEFRYYDGQQIVDMWDMAEEQSLPQAIEVTIWLASAHEAAAGASSYDAQGLLNTARQYRQTVFLPMVELSRSGASGGMSGASASSSSGSSTSSSSSSSSSGASSSAFGSSSGGP